MKSLLRSFALTAYSLALIAATAPAIAQTFPAVDRQTVTLDASGNLQQNIALPNGKSADFRLGAFKAGALRDADGVIAVETEDRTLYNASGSAIVRWPDDGNAAVMEFFDPVNDSWENGLTFADRELALYFNGAGPIGLRPPTSGSGSGSLSFSGLTAGRVFTLPDASGTVLLNGNIGSTVQGYHANLAALSGLTLAADRLPYATGVGAMALATFTTAGRNLIDDADAAAQRSTLGLTAAATGDASGLTSGTLPAARLPAFTGDITTSAGSATTTLATVNSNVGSYGSATAAPIFTVNGKGLITAASSATITPAWSSVTGKPTAVDGTTAQVANTFYAGPAAGANAPPSFRSVTTADVQTPVMAFAGPRQAAPHFVSDGLTSGRGIRQGPFAALSRGDFAAVPLASWEGWVPVPATNPGVTLRIAALVTDLSDPITQVNRMAITMNTSGGLSLTALGATSGDLREFAFSGFRAAYSGRRVWLRCLFTAGTTAPTVWVDGVDISASFTGSTTGTPPDWLASSLVSTYHVTAYNWPEGETPHGAWLVGHMTAAESAGAMISGRWPSWVQIGARPHKITGNNSTFGGAGNWSLSNATVDAANNELDVSGPIYTGTSLASGSFGGMQAGAIYRLRFVVRNFVTTSGSPWLQVRLGTTSQLLKDFVANGTHEITFSLTSTTSIADINILSTNGACNWSLAQVTLHQLGAFSLLTPQSIAVAHDWTEIGGADARLVGLRGITECPNWTITWDSTSNAAGGQAILGGDILNSTRDVIDSIEQVPSTGTPTTSIGHATGSLTTYKASGALTSGINPVTLATRKLSANQIWVYQSTTDSVRTTITGRRTN